MKGLDEIVPYPTPKIARIKDSKLGLLRYALMFIILIYVVGYQIMWRGNHLENKDLTGVYQLQLAHPTRHNCDPQIMECMQNFTSMSKLPYCSQSPEAGPIKLPCQYWDAQQLMQVTDQGLMIPTHIATFQQTRGCQPSAANNFSCVGYLYDFLDNKGEVQADTKRGEATPIDEFFVADIERYTLMIDHSVRSTLGRRSYASDMVGYWLDCKRENQSDAGCLQRPIACEHKNCHGKEYLPAKKRDVEPHPKFRGDRRSLSLAGTKDKSQRWKRRSQSVENIVPDDGSSERQDSTEPEDDDDSDATAALQLQKGEDLLQEHGSPSQKRFTGSTCRERLTHTLSSLLEPIRTSK